MERAQAWWRCSKVVGVKNRLPVIAVAVFEAGEGVPALVAVVDVAVRRAGPDDLRHGVGQFAELFFSGQPAA